MSSLSVLPIMLPSLFFSPRVNQYYNIQRNTAVEKAVFIYIVNSWRKIVIILLSWVRPTTVELFELNIDQFENWEGKKTGIFSVVDESLK